MKKILESVLRWPSIYRKSQALLRRKGAREKIVQEMFCLKAGESVLDLGCGPGNFLEVYPEGIEYYGIDINPDYIAEARKNFAGRGTFEIGDVSNLMMTGLKFEVVVGIGILHHLDDEQCLRLFKSVKELLLPGGRFVTFDPCFLEGQSWIAKFLISNDRGEFVRNVGAYEKLFSTFSNVKIRTHNDLMRIPYDHVSATARL